MGYLKVMKLEWVNQDKYGKILSRHVENPNSYVLGMIDLLSVQMSQINRNIQDITNTTRSVPAHANNYRLDAGVGVVAEGIVLGTGNNAVDIDNYSLQTPINHGVGVGQLQYLSPSFTAPVTSGTTRFFTIARSFVNGSGGDITALEIAIYVYAGSAPWSFCIERSITNNTIVNLATGTATYTIGVTV